ncbi:NPCBM/NEW2 domain-containing protein [Thermobifida halotolerans]|uniref:non-specific serine/threonine protein kinase n=1 Tax=Thermobifida halotolerans TaxID=483545 RepID=A0AA97LYR0_9ACTN|nr:NPCBM/NEW2 domain-containing protein [Thermobifida halotolerans]UOE20461.1 NPCBM/NEW2 domain-containing protein [Thermobifida halotolerans]
MSSTLYVGPDSQPDKYRLVRSVGRGGEATLYLAEVTLAGQTEPVVVKVLNADVAATPEQFAELSRRWSEQAELLRFITRLGVVGVREHFEGAPEHRGGTASETTERALYLVMNHVDGVDLRDWRAEHAVEGPRAQRVALGYLEQIAEVLDVLHSGRATPSRRPVVHGDLSPGNIMINEDGQAVLVDFGLSRIAARHLTTRPWFTPGYAAPEIFNGEYSPASDRYAFGAITYFVLSGNEPPPSPEQLRDAFVNLPVMSVAGPEQRERIVMMFAADPAARPPALDWIKTVRSVSTSAPWSAPVTEPGLPRSGPAAPVPAPPAGAASAPPPEGPRVSGPPPRSGPVHPAADGAGVPREGAAPQQDVRFGGPGPQRPVGGLRGMPPAPAESAPAPPPQTPALASRPDTTAPMPAVSGPPSGPQRPWTSPHESGDSGGPARRRSRRPLLIGVAVLVVLAMVGASAATVYAMNWWQRVNAAAGTPTPGPQAAGQESADPGQGQETDESEASPPSTADGEADSERPDRPSSGEQYLATMDHIDEYGVQAANVKVNTVTYPRALVSSLYCYDDAEWIEYDLNRSWTTFEAVVGLEDTSQSDATVTFIVIVDGDEVANETVGLGAEREVSVDITGGLRLRLQVEPGPECGDANAVWGDPRVLG